jgi:hypothetical protein
MINQLEGLTGSSFNGKPIMRTGQKSPEVSGYELLAWAILEQAAFDLATFARYGLITPEGHCLPWPFAMQRRMKRARRAAGSILTTASAQTSAAHKVRTNTDSSSRGFFRNTRRLFAT